ncbi:DUF6266 family protein [Myroides sp. DW712]|uniref:DUF6266 family protein n=1 Tax=Myroides sp. DW712 TaxID=3389800 RepID=UPI00397A7E59
MGKMNNGLTGGFSGKVGTLVGSNVKGQSIIRNAPKKSSKKPTAGQLSHRQKFKLVSNFLRPLNGLIKRYFGSAQELKSNVNVALGYHLQEAVNQVEEGFVVNLSKVVISKGILQTIFVDTVTIVNKELTITWSANLVFGSVNKADVLTVVIYQKATQSMFILEQVAARGAGECKVQLPASFEDTGYGIWVFLTDVDRVECSTSVFLGEF